MRKINLTIIEDDINLCNIIDVYISKFYSNKINIVGIAHNGNDGYEIIKTNMPDIALIDIIMPKSDGITLLEELNESGIVNSICCIMLTAIGTNDIIKNAMDLGARYYFMKPYNLDCLIKRVIEIHVASENKIDVKNNICEIKADEVIISSKINSNDIISKDSLPEIAGQNPAKYAAYSLDYIGIPPNLTGYNYLKYGIEAVINDPTLLNALTKRLYPAIGKMYGTSATKVERSIRNCLEVAWAKNSGERYCAFLGNFHKQQDNKPKSGLFILQISTYYLNSNL